MSFGLIGFAPSKKNRRWAPIFERVAGHAKTVSPMHVEQSLETMRMLQELDQVERRTDV
jgi:hypothetical protein